MSGLVAQWIEHCTGIARSWVRIPFKPEFFSGCFFHLLKLIAHCEDQISLMFHPQFAYMISYIHIHVFHYHRVYDELTIDHLSMWLGSSVDRALHRYRKVMGSNPVQA